MNESRIANHLPCSLSYGSRRNPQPGRLMVEATYSLVVPDNSFAASMDLLQSVWISVDTQQGYRRNVRGLQRRLNGCAIPDNHDGEMVKIDILLCSAHNIIFGDRRYVFGVLLVEIIHKTQHVNPCDRPVDCADRCELIW